MKLLALALSLTSLLLPHVSSIPMQERGNPDFPNPTVDPFYANPSTISNYQNGQVIRERSVKTNIFNLNLGSSYQLFYKTQNTQLEADGTVATVWIPKKPSSPPKILSYQVYEDSVAVDCAPSWAYVSGSDSNNKVPVSLDTPIYINWALNQGYYVVSADHEGRKGAFIAGHQEGMAVLDGIKALRNHQKLPSNTPVVMFGYSGGAHATVWAETLAGQHAPDLNVVGTTHGGTPIDPQNLFNFLNKGPFAGFAGAGIFGLSNAYPELYQAFVGKLNSKGQASLKKYNTSGFCIADVVIQFPFTDFLKQVDLVDPFSIPAIQNVLRKETLLKRVSSQPIPVPKFPRYLYHAAPDEIVPYADEREYVQDQCSQGANILFNTMVIAEHVSAEIFGIPGALLFIKQAFEGNTPKVVCGTSIPDIPSLLSSRADEIMGKDLADQARALQGKKSIFGTTISF
ncbi:lipase A [Violaceomyces palustris]|uniref:Lipase A n=1 Tax=Violaceomyces palustris TaxID=1673888 RepID=A0ACD0NR02_9BASI|nr:lipase A [Violaceomyces palustris]